MVARSRSTLSVTIGALFALCVSVFIVSPAVATPWPAASDAPEPAVEYASASTTFASEGMQKPSGTAPSLRLAGEPSVEVLLGSVTVSTFIYPRTAAGASAARNFIHSDQLCEWNFCTMQSSANGTRYKVFMFDPAVGMYSSVSLNNFQGLWDTHNHSGSSGGYTVEFKDANDRLFATYGPGRRDTVQWTPIYYLGFDYPW